MPTTNRHHPYSSDTDRFVAEKEQLHNENSFQGLLLGLSLALFFGGGAIALFFLSRSNEIPTPATTSTLAPSAEPSSSIQPSTQTTTIIREKTQELVPAPQEPSVQPNININVPDSKPSVNQPPNSEVPSAQQTTQAPPASSASPEAKIEPQSSPDQ
jgi:hypothetical protein